MLIASLPASGETVLLTRGGGEHGLGWLFLHTDGSCRVATPRHVVERDDRTLVPPDMLDRFGGHHATADPVAAPDPERDLAFLRVTGRLAAEGCTSSRLSAVSLSATILRMNTGFLSIATPFDRQQIQVEQKAAARDAEGGTVIAIAPAPGAEPLRKGMSGGTVMFENRPVAMLTNVDADFGIGVALRFDIIAAQLAALSEAAREPARQTGSAVRIAEIVLVDGIVSQADGGLSAFNAGLGDMVLEPVRKRVSFILDLGELRAVSSVAVGGRLADGYPEAIIVEASSRTTGFMPADRCPLAGDAVWRCTFSGRYVDRLRVTLPTEAAVTITSFVVE